MKLEIVKTIRKYTHNLIKTTLYRSRFDEMFYVEINNIYYNIDKKSNQLIKGTGYTLHNGQFVKFIGMKGTNYSTCKNLFRFAPGDQVKGYIKDNIFVII